MYSTEFLVLIEWQLAYKESLEKHGSVSVEVTPCVIVGASATGKSSLKHLMVHDTPKAVKTSTAVIDTPAVVSVSSEQYTVERGTSAWQLVDSDVMGKSIQECVTAKAYDEDQYPEPLRHQDDQHQQLEEQMGSPNPPTSLKHLIQKFIRFCRSKLRVSDTCQADPHQGDSGKSSQSSQRDVCAVMEGCNSGSSEAVAVLEMEHSHFMQEMKGGCESFNLKNASFVHLLDTGSQPSFQDPPPPSYWMSPARTSKCSTQPKTWTSPYPSPTAVMTTQRSPSHSAQRQGGR